MIKPRETTAPGTNGAITASSRPRFRFSLRTLLLAITVLAVVMGSFKYQTQMRKRAIDALTKAGAEITYVQGSDGKPSISGPDWWQQLIGDEWLMTPDEIRFGNYAVTDEGIEPIRTLYGLRILDLSNTKIGDEGLAVLEKLTGLQRLYLMGTNVTDAGLLRLQHLKKLRILDLQGTQVTDAGLEYLRPLTNLQHLHLEGSRVTTIPEWMSGNPSLRVTID